MPNTTIEITKAPIGWTEQSQTTITGLVVRALTGDELKRWQEKEGVVARFEPGDAVVLSLDLLKAMEEERPNRVFLFPKNMLPWLLFSAAHYRDIQAAE